MTTRAHLLVLAITFANLGFVLRMVRKRQLKAKYSILWLSVGGLLILLAGSPALLDVFARTVGIHYEPAAFFLVAISFLFLVAVHFSWELSRLEDRTRKLAEELALLRLEDAPTGRHRAGRPPSESQEQERDEGPE